MDRALQNLPRLSRHIGLPDRAVVAESHEREQLLVEVVHGLHAVRHRRGRARVEHDEIGVLAGLDRADRVVEGERPGVAERHLVEGRRCRPRLAVELQNLIPLGRGPQHRVAGAAADVGGEPDPHPCVREPRPVEQSGAEEQVGGRAEGRDRAALGHRGHLIFGHVNAMAEHRARSQQPCPGVDVEIVARGRKELTRYDIKSKRFVAYLPGVLSADLDFSPDGKWMAYSEFSERTIWRIRTDGSERVQLTFPPLLAVTPRWSPDGKWIAFDTLTAEDSWKMYLVPSEGGAPQEVAPGASEQAIPTWSPDGQRLAFAGVGDRSTGIQVLDLRTRELSKLRGSEGHWAPKWSPDGRYMLAENSHSPGLAIYDFRSGKWETFGRITFAIAYVYWSHDGKYVYLNSNAAAPLVYRVRLADEKMEPVIGLIDAYRHESYGPWFGLTPDDSVLATRNASAAAIYALDVEWP